MKMQSTTLLASTALLLLSLSTAAQAQQAPPQSPNMTFFVVSAGPGKGADLGGTDESLVVDLNFLYHPSCRYSDSWVCPLAPADNTITAPVRAGERL